MEMCLIAAVPITAGHQVWPDPEPNLVPEPQGNPIRMSFQCVSFQVLIVQNLLDIFLSGA